MHADKDRLGWFRELQRPLEGRLVAGVCAALAGRLSLDVTLLRLAFVLLGLASGVGVLLYAALWVFVPGEDADLPSRFSYREVVRYNLRGLGDDLRNSANTARAAWERSGDPDHWPRPMSRRWIAIGLIGLGLVIFLYSVGLFAWLGPGRTLGLAIMALGAAVLFARAPQWRK